MNDKKMLTAQVYFRCHAEEWPSDRELTRQEVNDAIALYLKSKTPDCEQVDVESLTFHFDASA